MNNIPLTLTEEEVAKQQKLRNARKVDRNFFKIYYKGDINPPPRLHEIDDIIAYEVPNAENPSVMDIKTKQTTRVLDWDIDQNGDYYQDILDTEMNRFFVSSHSNIIEPEKELLKEIQSLAGKEYKTEVSELEGIERQIKELESRKTHLLSKKSGIDPEELKKKRRENIRKARLAKALKKEENGNDKSTSDMD